MNFRYNDDKNIKLEIERKIGFEEVINAIERGYTIYTEAHTNQTKYPNQQIMHVNLRNTIYSVPFIEEADGGFFLKTIFENRKARKKFLEKPKEPK